MSRDITCPTSGGRAHAKFCKATVTLQNLTRRGNERKPALGNDDRDTLDSSESSSGHGCGVARPNRPCACRRHRANLNSAAAATRGTAPLSRQRRPAAAPDSESRPATPSEFPSRFSATSSKPVARQAAVLPGTKTRVVTSHGAGDRVPVRQRGPPRRRAAESNWRQPAAPEATAGRDAAPTGRRHVTVEH